MITNEQARVAALASHVAYDNLGAYVELVGAGYEYAKDGRGSALVFDDPNTGFHAAILKKAGTNEYIVSIRGSQNGQSWAANTALGKRQCQVSDRDRVQHAMKVERFGFMRGLLLDKAAANLDSWRQAA